MALFYLPKAAPLVSGESLPFAKLYFYETGTSTEAVVYSDAGLTTPLSNPIEADSEGLFPAIYLDDFAQYRVVLTDQDGTTIPGYDVDPFLFFSLPEDAIRQTVHPQTDAETAAAITPADYTYPPGDVRRYGGDANGLQQAIDQNAQGGEEVFLPPGSITVNQVLTIYNNTKIRGSGRLASVLDCSGSCFAQETPGIRIYNIQIQDLCLQGAHAAGSIGLDLDSVSTGYFENLVISGFETNVKVYSPTSGYAVYNRFTNVTSGSATTGFRVHGTSSNAQVFYACRGFSCTTAMKIEDSNGNTVEASQFEANVDGIIVSASAPGLSPNNKIFTSRFENNSGTDIDIGVNNSDTIVAFNEPVGGWTVVDSGIRTQWLYNAGTTADNRVYGPEIVGGNHKISRVGAATTGEPLVVINDQNTGSGTPTTLKLITERLTGVFVEGNRGSAPYFRANADGSIAIRDGITAPSTITDMAVIYVDTSDGDLKIKFSDGTIKTIVVDT